MKKNSLIAGSMAQRKQNCFYVNEEGPHAIQGIFVFDGASYVETICNSEDSNKQICLCDVYSPSFSVYDDDDLAFYFLYDGFLFND